MSAGVSTVTLDADNETVTADQDTQLLHALLAGATTAQAAQIAGMNERTAYRRKASKEFARRYREMQAAMQQRSLQLLTAGGPTGIQSLIRLARGGWEREINPLTGEELVFRIPYTAQIQAAAKLTELAVGSLARVQLTIDADTDRIEVEDRTRVRLDAYREELVKLLDEHAPIEATAVEGTPVEPRLATQSSNGSPDSAPETRRATTHRATPQVGARKRA